MERAAPGALFDTRPWLKPNTVSLPHLLNQIDQTRRDVGCHLRRLTRSELLLRRFGRSAQGEEMRNTFGVENTARPRPATGFLQRGPKLGVGGHAFVVLQIRMTRSRG